MASMPSKQESVEERRFRLVVEAAPNAMVMIDRAGKIVMVNAQTELAFGYERAELLGQSIEMLVPERFRAAHPELRNRFFTEPRPRPMGAGRDLFGLKKDGSEFQVEIGLNPIDTDEGSMVLSAIVDISKRKAAELALRESERRYSVLVDGVTDYAIYMINPNGEIANWNRAAERIKGYSSEEIIGHHFSCFYTEEDRAANVPQQSLEIAARVGRYEADIAWRVRKDGSRFLANAVIDTLKDDHGQLIGFAKITRDVTERVQATRELEDARIRLVEARAEEALSRAQAELAHVARVTGIGELTASIGHEVNQPIAAILSSAQAALRFVEAKPPNLGEVRQALTRIATSAKRAGDIIDHIRELTRKSSPRMDQWDINDAIRDVVELTRGLAVNTGATVLTELAGGLALINADRVQLQQVLFNLVVNALEAMSTVGNATREVRITSAQSDLEVLVTVRDSGPGLVGVDPKHIFEPFHSTKTAGLGMGLSISRSIIESHGGRLWYEANVGQGASFRFTLPLSHLAGGPGGREREPGPAL